ncbi:MAG: tetraacyldisaccharide 4'-kinase [Gemmatimonadaceae bacterium]|nr:tetraacyldisaccharide 4'-kinase [Chitinophagaceae bacterium]
MNFNIPFLRPIRILLFPFSLVYWLAIFIRNKMFDNGLLNTHRFNIPIICVGNVATGGTGKSPMVEYIVKTLKDHIKLATLSRGYKRKTSGYALANNYSTALEIGDEPMQFHLKFPDVAIAVGEERAEAIPQILHDHPDTRVIILDDAFQHRTVEAGLNIVLTDQNNLYSRDWYLPTGDLRDEKRSAKRADIIVVTKCKPDLSLKEKVEIEQELDLREGQQIFFTCIRYGMPYHLLTKNTEYISPETEVLLVTGIANPAPLKMMLDENAKTYYELAYNDHHIFTIDDLNDVIKRFEGINAEQKMIVTTEKDAVRLVKFEKELLKLPIYAVPIEQQFLFNEGTRFNSLIGTFIKEFEHRTSNNYDKKKGEKEDKKNLR